MPLPVPPTVRSPLTSTSSFINNVTSKNQADPGLQARTVAASPISLGMAAQQQAYQGKLNDVNNWSKGLTATVQEGNLRRQAQEAAQKAAQQEQSQVSLNGVSNRQSFVNSHSQPGAPLQDVPAYTGDTSQVRNDLVSKAQSRLGTGYAWGGGGYNNFASRGTGKGTENVIGVDCSGLTSWAYGTIGMKIPRTSQGQTGGTIGIRTAVRNARPGDLIGFPGGGHVAMYAGNGQMIESPKPGGQVRYRAVPSNAFAVHLNLSGD